MLSSTFGFFFLWGALGNGIARCEKRIKNKKKDTYVCLW